MDGLECIQKDFVVNVVKGGRSGDDTCSRILD